MTRLVGIYIFDDVEILDFAGPYEVFMTASRMKARLEPDAPKPFEVITLARNEQMVQARGGLAIQSGFNILDHPVIDVLIIPGGVVTAELENKALTDWISSTSSTSTITASVCTGAFLLGKAGLLSGKSATTHWEDIQDMRAMFADVDVLAQKRWVDTGQIVTSAGISAGIDMSLYLVARLESEDLARKTARQMEFDWQSTSS